MPSNANGTKNNASITIVLTTILAFAFLLVLVVLKCTLTLFLNVLAKSEFRSLENVGFSIIFSVRLYNLIKLPTSSAGLMHYALLFTHFYRIHL